MNELTEIYCIFNAAGDVACYPLSHLHFLIVYPFFAAWIMAFLVFKVAPWALSFDWNRVEINWRVKDIADEKVAHAESDDSYQDRSNDCE